MQYNIMVAKPGMKVLRIIDCDKVEISLSGALVLYKGGNILQAYAPGHWIETNNREQIGSCDIHTDYFEVT